MTLLEHTATVDEVSPGVWQGRCSAVDFEGPERDSEEAALADLTEHLAAKQLVTHRSGRHSYVVRHADGTEPLSDVG